MASGHLSAQSVALNRDGVVGRRIWVVGLLAIVASVLANLVVRLIVVRLLDVPAGFLPLQPGPITFFTTIGATAGVVVFAIIAWYVPRPIRTFNIVACVALLVSIIPNIMLALDPAAAPMPGGTMTLFLVLIIFHIIPAAICIGMLSTLTRSR